MGRDSRSKHKGRKQTGSQPVKDRRPEAALRESEQLFRSLTTSAPVGIFQADAEGKGVYVNEQVCRFTGRPAEEHLGHGWATSMHPDDQEHAFDAWRSAVADGEDFHGEFRFVSTDGVVTWLSSVAVPLTDDTGTCTGFIGTLTDITERKRSAQAIAEAQERYRQVITTTTDAVMIFDAETHQFLEVNRAWEELYGYSGDELLNLTLDDITAEPERTKESIEKLLAGQLDRIPVRYHKKKDGTVFPVEISGSTFQLGERTVLCGIVRDITERKRMEEELRDSEEKLRTVIDHSHEVYYIHDTAQQLTYVSPRCMEVFGYTPEQMTVKWTTLVTDNPINEKGVELTQRAIETGERQSPYLLEIERKDGQFRWIEIDESPVKDSDGKVIAISGGLRDVTERKQATEAVLESEERYRILAERNPHGIQVIDRDGVLTYVNPAYQEMLGCTSEELLGKHVVDLLEPASRRPQLREYLSLLVKEQPEPTVYFQQNRRKDGQVIDQAVAWNYSRDGEGNVVGFISIITDITERKQAEAQVRSLSELARQSMDSMVQTDAEFRITYVNPAAERLFGWTLAELKGKTPDLFNAEPAADEIQKELYATVSSGRTYSGETLNRRKDGSTFLCQFKISPLVDAEAQIVGYLGIQRDITERKQAEEDLRRERDFADTLIETAQTIVLLMDTKGRIVRFNPYMEGICGYSLSEVKGKDWFDTFLPERDRKRIRALFRKAVNDIQTHGNVNPIVARDGQERQIEWYDKTINDADGNVVGVLSTGQDITERMLTEQQLRQAQKMEAVGQLAGGVAHDFRNQLAVIMNWAEMLLVEGLTDQTGRQHVDEILKAVGRSTKVIGQLLAFSRKEILQPKAVNVTDLVVDLGKTLSHMIEEDVRLSIVPGGTDIHALLDPSLLEQAVMTLAVNSRDAMPNGGELRIQTAVVEVDAQTVARYSDVQPGRFAVVSVADTGIGMDEDTRLRIFDPFFTTKDVGKGTGLGLSMVYGFIRQSGGFVECESEPGKGTVVRIAFPLVAAPAKAVEATPAKAPPPTAKGTETILLVEDHLLLRKVTVAMLERAGYEVLEASDAAEAMLAAKQRESGIDMLITDVVMPGMGGPELAEQILSADPHLPVLFVSGYGRHDLIRRGLAYGDGALLVKPFRYDELMSRVRAMLDAAGDRKP